MKDETRKILNAINAAFYRDQAASFDATREAPWPGWEAVLPFLAPKQKSPLKILDLGCGNGRFAHFLHREVTQPYAYTGLDASAPLLALAKEHAPDSTHSHQFAHWDFVDTPPPADLENAFDLIGVFGVMHHVPSQARRRQLMEDLVARMADQGLLAVAFWQFADEARFARRILPWDQLGDDFPLDLGDLDLQDLEPGDHLLRWGQGDTAYRYCHHVAPSELEGLFSGLPLELLADYRADGREQRLNRYHVFRKIR